MRHWFSPMPYHCLKAVQVIFWGSALLFTATPGFAQTADQSNWQEDLQQDVKEFLIEVDQGTQKLGEFFATLKEGEQKRRELAEQNRENVRESQEKAREASEAARRLQEETRIKLEEARMRQKEQLRMMQDRMRR